MDHTSSRMLRLVAWLVKTGYYKERLTTSIDRDSKYLLNFLFTVSHYMELHPVSVFLIVNSANI